MSAFTARLTGRTCYFFSMETWMPPDHWLGYLATILVVLVWPGPSVLLSAAHGMAYGLPRTFGTIAGDLSANTLQMISVFLGLGAVITASPNVLVGLKWFGALYLIHMGVKRWTATGFDFQAVRAIPHDSVFSLYKQGFFVSAFNPKAILFYLAIFPQFIDPRMPYSFQFAVLGITVLLMDGVTLTLYARFAQKLQHWLSNDPVRLNRITGFLLIAAAVILIL